MNASELADYLLNFIMTVEDYDESKHENASTMLRQQQAEIEALKAHPVKELTNDEMRKVINEIVDGVTVSEMVTFLAISRAILKRSQEK